MLLAVSVEAFAKRVAARWNRAFSRGWGDPQQAAYEHVGVQMHCLPLLEMCFDVFFKDPV